MKSQHPYKGLAPYDQHDRDNFFGREHEKDVLLGKILSHRLTLLYAATGVGKSSLLGAAVIPELEDLYQENLDVAYHRTWIDDPTQAVQTTVKQALCRRKKLVEAELPQFDNTSLTSFFDLCMDYCSDPLILILDQFEEFFRYHSNTPFFSPFIEQLSEVIADETRPLHVVISMREDFLAELSVFRGHIPALYNNCYRLQKLTHQQAHDAIVMPLKGNEQGFRYEENLPEMLLQDLSEREREQSEIRYPDLPQRTFVTIEGPYLQIVCMALWNHDQNNPDRTIRIATYKALGGADTIVKRYFEQIMATCTPAQRRLASRAFAFLATEWGTKMAYPERVLAQILRVKLTTLHPVLEKLKAARILRDEERPEGTWYELYHDVFTTIIGEWSNAFRARRRKRLRLGLAALILAFACSLGFATYQGYQMAEQKARIAHLNPGTLHVRNPLGATLTLTCIRHYDPDRECLEGTISLTGKSIALPGPADYVLTAHKADGTVSYPVYIDGLTHEMTLDIEPTPEPSVPGMVYIPSGVFRMGDKDRHDVAGLANERPHHDVEITGFFMDIHEVTNDEYRQCVEANACTKPHYEDGACYHPLPDGEIPDVFRQNSHPVVCIDWQQAMTYCRYVGKRLPTEAEWEKAAGGPEGYMWAFGNTFDASHANTSESGHNATTPVGRYAPNGYGLYDMSGNAMEWVEDVYDGTFYHTSAAVQKNPVNRHEGDGRRVQRGGSWWHGIEGVRTSRRHLERPTGASSLTGFRCARSLDANSPS